MLTRRSALTGLAGLTIAPTIARAAGEKYRGATVRMITERNSHQIALQEKLGEIAKSWGVTLDVRNVTTDEIESKVVIDYVGGAETWDLIYTGGVQRMAQWAYGGIIKDIAPIIKAVGDPKLLAWDQFTDAARHAVTDGDKVWGLTCATSEQSYVYRRDIFEDASERAAFEKRFGYPLTVPPTYARQQEVVAFFTRKRGEMLAGKPLDRDFYGTILCNKRGTFLWHTYENFVAAFGVSVYDPKTKKVGLTSAANLALVKAMKDLVPYLPPSHINLSSGEAATMFGNGQAALLGEYFDREVLTMTRKGTPVTLDMVGFAFFPTAEGNPKGAVGGMRSGPPVVAIYGRSRNAEAAYKLLEAALAPESMDDMARKYQGYMPARMEALQVKAAADPTSAYLLKLAATKITAMTDFDILPYPSILKASEIVDAVTGVLSDILVAAPGAPIEPKLAEMQAKVEQIVAPL
jgi:multiple sugar transport system substrate-binding protein